SRSVSRVAPPPPLSTLFPYTTLFRSKHPAPLYTYVVAGEVEVELEGGKLARYGAGDVVYEVVDSWHNGVNRGNKDVRLIVFALGSEGAPLVIPRERGGSEV